jgi:hypothetical protein
MPRPHIEFVHAPQLEWQRDAFAAHGWPALDAKLLSVDATNGGCTALLRLPAGFHAPRFTLSSYFELFVIDGAATVDGREFGLDAYGFLPRGHRFQSLASERGAVLLAFFDRAPHLQHAAMAAPDSHARGAPDATIAHLDTLTMPWTSADIDPSVQFLRLAHKVLRHVPATGAKTLLLSTGAQSFPNNFREAQLRHDCVEELYLLGGDLSGDRGTMYEGAYFWRPAGIWHGPFGSRRGSLSLIRFVDGQHRNNWGADKHTFTFEPRHAPSLPADVPAAARGPWSPPRY